MKDAKLNADEMHDALFPLPAGVDAFEVVATAQLRKALWWAHGWWINEAPKFGNPEVAFALRLVESGIEPWPEEG